MSVRKPGISKSKRSLILVVLAVYAMTGVRVDASELRQTVSSFESTVAAWESGPTHAVCDVCSPVNKLTVAPPDYAENIIKARVPFLLDPSVEQKEKDEKEARVDEKPELEKSGQVTVFFDFDSAHLKSSDLEKLKNIIVPSARYEITGYTCSIGDEDHNNRLAMRRARSVYHAFLKMGLDAARITVTGKGRCCYADSNSKSGRNRRAEVILYKERR